MTEGDKQEVVQRLEDKISKSVHEILEEAVESNSEIEPGTLSLEGMIHYKGDKYRFSKNVFASDEECDCGN